MKFKILSVLFVAFMFFGCASSGTPKISSKTSEALFIQTSDNNQSVFINFKNSTSGDMSVNSDIATEFIKRGFRVSSEAKTADYVVIGDVQSFDRFTKRDENRARFYMGYGFGRRPFGAFGLGFPLGYYDDDFYTNSYIYVLNASVLIKSKDGDKSTMITLSHGGSTYSPSYIWPFFKQRLAEQIVAFFYKF
ncbi:hypothetical protein CCAL12920_05860 [Campylobacter sp. RM12920]|uniref:TraT complement resistance protein n=1 Tax=Campylobacter californiensis TaxID=1032243 RepID=A0ABD4JIA9_9BACT|nr:hypothetical protein [Campylobacter sp. RM12919]MBE2988418.1 hypothetical protein [Campylobacter sp. RM12920]